MKKLLGAVLAAAVLAAAGAALADNLGVLTSDTDRGYREVTHAETVAFWLEHSQRDLTEEDAREATANVVGFFTPSNEWRETMSDAGRASSSTSDAGRDT